MFLKIPAIIDRIGVLVRAVSTIYMGMAMTGDDIQEIKSPHQIWEDDLLGRREEAEFLIQFIDGVVANPGLGRAGQGFTIGVDAGYGEGKTFFLTRLEKHLKIDHSVAFIDAWADDLADQPLIALMATLKSAIKPKLKSKKIRAKWNSFLKKGGEVVKIGALGAMKRGLGLVITNTAVHGIDEVMSHPSDDIKTRTGDAAQNLSSEVYEGAVAQFKISRPMDAKITEFNEGKAAIKAAKDSLSVLANSLENQKPIVIIIDELDRCRPTYAIKLLEEIKHMFDVPGVVFILGLHGDQLGHSVRGAYGPTFDGHSYLRRFINRRYILEPHRNGEFISAHLNDLNMPLTKIRYLNSWRNIGDIYSDHCELYSLISNYSYIFSLSTRDIAQVLSHLDGSVLCYDGQFIIMEYYIPLLVAFMKSTDIDDLWKASKESSREFLTDRQNNIFMSPKEVYYKYDKLTQCSQAELKKIYDENIIINSEGRSPYRGVTDNTLLNFDLLTHNQSVSSLTLMSNYLKLINNLSRLQQV